jgi:hypothetical protein
VRHGARGPRRRRHPGRAPGGLAGAAHRPFSQGRGGSRALALLVRVRPQQARRRARPRPRRGTGRAAPPGRDRGLPDRVRSARRDGRARPRLRGPGGRQSRARLRLDHAVRAARAEGPLRDHRLDRARRLGRHGAERRAGPRPAAGRRHFGVDVRGHRGGGRRARRPPGTRALRSRSARRRLCAARDQPLGRLQPALGAHRSGPVGAQRRWRGDRPDAPAVHLGGGGRLRVADAAARRPGRSVHAAAAALAARGGRHRRRGRGAGLGHLPGTGARRPGGARAARRAAREHRELPARAHEAGAARRRRRALPAARPGLDDRGRARERPAFGPRVLARARARAPGRAAALPGSVRVVRPHADPLSAPCTPHRRAHRRGPRRAPAQRAGARRFVAQRAGARRFVAQRAGAREGGVRRVGAQRRAWRAPARRAQGARLHVGHGGPIRHARSGGLRRHGREGRVGGAPRPGARAAAVLQGPARPGELGIVRQPQRGQAQPLPRPRPTRRARHRARPRALGRRRHRGILPRGDAAARARLPVHLPVRPDGSALEHGRLRHHGGRGRRARAAHGLARPRPGRTLRTLHRLARATLHVAEPARGSTSTSRRPSRRCTSWPRRCWTAPRTET